jgi:hypothetical protein
MGDLIERFFVRYGAALSSGDVAAIAAAYAPPALVVADDRYLVRETASDGVQIIVVIVA